MYSRAENSLIRKTFWTTFGQYMKPIPSASEERVNWQNYKTYVKNIFFRMKAERGFASIGIEINHGDLEMQELVYDQFLIFKNMLQETLGEEWTWVLHTEDEFGKTVSKIEKTIHNVNVMDKNDWPTIISFLKPRMIALDEFWVNIKPAFEDY